MTSAGKLLTTDASSWFLQAALHLHASWSQQPVPLFALAFTFLFPGRKDTNATRTTNQNEKPPDLSLAGGRRTQKNSNTHTHTHPDLSLAGAQKNGAGEGVRAGDVDQRGARAGVPGGGQRLVRGRQHRLRGQGAQESRSPRQKPVRANPSFPGWRSPSFRIARNCKVRAS